MVDIAASLSLTPSSLTLDPSAILGAETADIQAFGDLLAGQVKAAAGRDAAAALPTLPTAVAGNRQAGGNILPGAAAILPDMVNGPAVPAGTVSIQAMLAMPVQAVPVEGAAPAGRTQGAPAQTAPAQTPPAHTAPAEAAIPATPALSTKPALLTTAVRLAVPAAPDGELATTAAETAEPTAQPAANPVHALLKLVAAAIRNPRQADGEAAAAPADQDAAPQTDTAEPAAVAHLAVGVPVLPVPMSPILTSATPSAPAPTASQAQAAAHPFVAAADPLAVSLPQLGASDRGQQPQAEPVPGQTAATPAPRTAAQADIPSVPVLTVAAVPAETVKAAAAPIAAVTLTAAPMRSAAPVATARIQVAVGDKQPQTAAAGIAAAPTIDRVLPAAAPMVTDSTVHAPLVSAAATPAAPVNTAPVATAPTVEMPRQDFAALVERLVEARNAAAPVSTHASVQHAEFGQVTLNFQQDGNNLKVGMSSADPGFTAAVQAAMPAQNQNLNADARGQQNQSASQPQSQSANTSSQSNQEAAGQRSSNSSTDQQGGHRQGRGGRGDDHSNPSQRWTGEQPQSRGGIFA